LNTDCINVATDTLATLSSIHFAIDARVPSEISNRTGFGFCFAQRMRGL
jgi:hypothetical protein